MDNRSDSTITFDENGYCNYCTQALEEMDRVYFPNEEGQRKIEELVGRLKEENKKKPYDCIMGISGGLDSSYLAYLAKEKWGLRILAVHIDDGFDEPVAIENIRKLCEKLEIRLIVEKPNAEQFCDLTRAFFLAGVPNLAIPQDNILFAYLYDYARKYKIRSFLSGGNFALEGILQRGNSHDNSDKKHILAIHKRFGTKPVDQLPFLSQQRKLWDKYVRKIETVCPLNYIDYNRDRAINELKEFCGFEYYGSKHLENKLTKFIQLYYFYNKFGVDKRTPHLSSMIVSGQMSRDEALRILEQPLYDPQEMDRDIDFILDKLQLSREEFEDVMHQPPKQHTDYPTSSFNKRKQRIGKLIHRG